VVTTVVFLAFERRHRNWLLIDARFRGERSEPSPTDWNTSSGTLAVCFGLWRASPNHCDVIYFFDTRLVEEVFRICGTIHTGGPAVPKDRSLALFESQLKSRVLVGSRTAFHCHFECRSLALAGRLRASALQHRL
jgi:hypothetical protein